MSEVLHSIKVAAQRAGLSPHVLRVWERRYATVQPQRVEGGRRRLYTESEINRLKLLRELTEAGHSIGDISPLSSDALLALRDRRREERLEEGSQTLKTSLGAKGVLSDSPIATKTPFESTSAQGSFDFAITAVDKMDSTSLNHILDRALVDLGPIKVLNEVVSPLIEYIGKRWFVGELQVSHEHVATVVIRTFLGNLLRSSPVYETSPTLLSTTPSGQHHELGAMLVACIAGIVGWNVIYAGPSLPAEDIAGAVQRSASSVVALSLVHPVDDPRLRDELARIRQLLPLPVRILVGGRAASFYRTSLEAIHADWVASLSDFAMELVRIREQKN